MHIDKEEVILSFDTEFDAESPASGNLRSIGIVVFKDSEEIDSLELNIIPRMKIIMAPDKQAFWSRFPEAYARLQKDALHPQEAMRKLSSFLKKYQDCRVKWVAGPANNDWQFINYYYTKYHEPGFYKLPYKVECLSTLRDTFFEMACISRPTQSKMMAAWRGDAQHTHVAVEDAREAGRIYCGIKRAMAEFVYNQMEAAYLREQYAQTTCSISSSYFYRPINNTNPKRFYPV